MIKNLIGEFDFCTSTPNDWLKKFEHAVRSCLKDAVEDDYYFSYLPYFLNVTHRSWFFNARKDGQSWVDFKKSFLANFWSKYWNFIEKTFQLEPEDDASMHEFVKEKIVNLKKVSPEMSEKSIIMHCILDLPEETRPHLQSGLSESLEMFLSMVEAVDFQFGRAKQSSDENVDIDILDSASLSRTTPTQPASLSKTTEATQLPPEFLNVLEAKLLASTEAFVNNCFSSPQFAQLIAKIVAEVNKN